MFGGPGECIIFDSLELKIVSFLVGETLCLKSYCMHRCVLFVNVQKTVAALFI